MDELGPVLVVIGFAALALFAWKRYQASGNQVAMVGVKGSVIGSAGGADSAFISSAASLGNPLAGKALNAWVQGGTGQKVAETFEKIL